MRLHTISKYLTGAVLGLCLAVSNAHALSAGFISRIILGESEGVEKKLATMGIEDMARLQLVHSLQTATKVLNKGTIPASEDALKKLMAMDPDLLRILTKSEKDLTEKDLMTFANKSARIADRVKIGNAYSICDKCVDPALRKIGINIVASEVTGQAADVFAKAPTGKALEDEIMNMIRGINQDAAKAGTKIKVSDFAAAQMAQFTESDKVKFHTFLTKASSGKAAEKNLGREILRMQGNEKGATLVDNRVWLVMTDNMSDDEMNRLAAVMKQVNDENPDSATARIRAFRRWFERNADSPELKEAFEQLKKNNCWGIFPAA